MMPNPITVPMTVAANTAAVPMTVAATHDTIPITVSLSVSGRTSPEWQGAYVYTPTQAEQTIPMEGFVARQDITINPIPSNYGLITWNGATLTVS